MKDSYATLHTHSEFSNLRLRDSINRISEMLESSYDKGLTGLCLTDHETISGHIEATIMAEKLREEEKISEDFKLMLGDEIYLVDDLEEIRESGMFYHFLLIAKNKKGHRILSKISSQAWENMFMRGGMERIPITKEQLESIMTEENGKGNVVASTACLGSEFSQRVLDLIVYETVIKHIENGVTYENLVGSDEAHVLLNRYLPDLPNFLKVKWKYLRSMRKGKRDKEEEEFYQKTKNEMLEYYCSKHILDNPKAKTEKLKEKIREAKVAIHKYIFWGVEVFGKEDYYIEIQPSLDPEQLLYNRYAIDIANAYELEYIATTDAHFINEEDITFQEAFLNAQEGDREVASFYLSCFIHTPKELSDRLSEGSITTEEIKVAMENTNKISKECEEYSLYEHVVVPRIDIDENSIDLSIMRQFSEDYEFIGKHYHSDNVQDRYFLHLVQEGMKNKSLEYTKERLDRIEVELKEIWLVGEGLRQKMSQYYISAREFINIMWEAGDSLVGVARGSITGMFTAYLIDIIQLNPMEHDLPHWRLVK